MVLEDGAASGETAGDGEGLYVNGDGEDGLGEGERL